MESDEDVKCTVVPLFADHKGTTVACIKWGRGSVVLMPGGGPLSNQGITRGQNLALVLNAISYRQPKGRAVITFDEFHHGYGRDKGIMSLISTPAKLGLAQLAFAFILVVVAGIARFGRVIPLREGVRQRGEYLGSMSALLRKSHATELVWEELGRRFIADVAASVGLSPNAHPDDIIDAISARRPDKAAEISVLCNAAIRREKKPTEASVLTLARKWHQMRKELTK